MNYILFDDVSRPDLFPFTQTRPIADIRCGILTMRERWEKLLDSATGTLTESYLQEVFPVALGADNLFINGAVFGDRLLTEAVRDLDDGYALTKAGLFIAARFHADNLNRTTFLDQLSKLKPRVYEGDVHTLKNVWDIFSYNDRALRADFQLTADGRESAAIPENVVVTGKNNLFIEPGTTIYGGCVINAATGPVYIGKDVEILEGTMIRGPFAACEHSVVKMGAKIYGATTIGPGCKVGGEINNAVFFANSNKSHDGYLGNAVIGEWCNLGADTNCSNLKNNYDEIKIWSARLGKLIPTGLIFCGLIMGDHSKCGINTMFNTGTVVGVSCNIFGGGFPEKFIPSFSWGGSEDMVIYLFDKAMETANRMMGRRGKRLTSEEMEMYRRLFEQALADATKN